MTDGTRSFSRLVGVIPAHRAQPPFRYRCVSFVFVALAFSCVGCQSIPAADRSSGVPNDLTLPVLPSGEGDGDDDTDPRRAFDPDEDSPADAPEPEGRPFLGFPIGKLLDDTLFDDEQDAGDPPKPKRYTLPDIREPGPDTANFPNSPFTLPQGRFYVEASPAFISGPSRGTPATYNAEFLLRYGLTDRVELRLFGNGPTFERHPGTNGFGPIAYDIKTNLWKENEKYHIPAVGLEVFLLTPSGSSKLNQGTQPSVNLLFGHTLPFGVVLEWNVGLVGDPSPNNNFSAIEPAAAWAFEREIVKDVYGFLQGYFNGPTLPRYGDGVELGGGVRWTLNRRFALWASYNGGVSKEAPTTIFYAGGAISF